MSKNSGSLNTFARHLTNISHWLKSFLLFQSFQGHKKIYSFAQKPAAASLRSSPFLLKDFKNMSEARPPDSFQLCTCSLPLSPSWYFHMSNGITTASSGLVQQESKGRARCRRKRKKRGINRRADTGAKSPTRRRQTIRIFIRFHKCVQSSRFTQTDFSDSGPLKETHRDLLFSSKRP